MTNEQLAMFLETYLEQAVIEHDNALKGKNYKLTEQALGKIEAVSVTLMALGYSLDKIGLIKRGGK